MRLTLKKLLICMISLSVGTAFIWYRVRFQESETGEIQTFVNPIESSSVEEIQDQNTGPRNTCEVISVTELIKFGKNHQFPNGVPRIIHYVYRTLEVPIQYSPLITECMSVNKDTRFVFWTDDLAREFVKKHFPNSLTIYNSYTDEKVERLKLSDINRYFILLKFGGIYVDMDTKCQKPFQSVMVNSSCILSTEPKEQSRIRWNYEFLAMNSMMACVSNHRFFYYLINHLKPADNTDILAQTGPFLVTKLFISYSSLFSNESGPDHSITLAHSDVFSPRSEFNLSRYCHKEIRGRWRIQGCKDIVNTDPYQNEKEKEAVAIHLFLHLGYDFAQDMIRELIHICTTFESVFLVQA